MKRIYIDILEGPIGPKRFYSTKERLQVEYIPLNQINQYAKTAQRDLSVEGIYLLMGENAEGNKSVYIGETDDLNRRLYHHIRDDKKSFADSALLITSYTMQPVSKDELHFIEKKLIKLFESSRYTVENGNKGQGKELRGTDKLLVEDDIEFIVQALEAFGIKLENAEAITIPKNNKSLDSSRGDVDIYCTAKDKTKIFGILHPNNSVTIKGGQSFIIEEARMASANQHLIKASIRFHENNENVIFKGDSTSYSAEYVNDTWFRSPSGASVLMKSGASNGWLDWRTVDTDEQINKYRK